MSRDDDHPADEVAPFQLDTGGPARVAAPHSRDYQRLAVQMQCWGAFFLLIGLFAVSVMLFHERRWSWDLLAALVILVVGGLLFATGSGFASYQRWAWYSAVCVLLPFCALNSLLILVAFVIRGCEIPSFGVTFSFLYVFYVAWVLVSRSGRRRYQETVDAVARARAAPDSLAGRELLAREQAIRNRRKIGLAIAGSLALGLALVFGMLNLQKPRMSDPKEVVDRLGSIGWGEVDDAGNVHKLSFSRTPNVGDDEMEGLELLTRIVELDLSKTQITDKTLARVGQLKSLRKLWIRGVPLSDAGLAELVPLDKLEWLELDDTPVTSAGLEHLKDSKKLKRISLRQTQTGDAGLAALGRIPTLEILELSGCPVTDQGLAHLKGLDLLDTLELTGTQVSDTGMAHLAELKKLRKAVLRKTAVTAEGVKTLKKGRPFCQVAIDQSR